MDWGKQTSSVVRACWLESGLTDKPAGLSRWHLNIQMNGVGT